MKNKLKKIPISAVFILSILAVALAFVVLVPHPDKVTGIKAKDVTYHSAVIAWDKVENAAEYYVYKLDESGEYKQEKTTKDTFYKDDGLTTGKKYKYRVVASNYIKLSKSPSAITVTPELDVPQISSDMSTGEVRIKVSCVDGAEGYVLYRDGKQIATQKAGKDKSLYLQDDKAKPDKKYSYQVAAYRGESLSEKSKPQSVLLKTVGKISAKIELDKLVFSWDGDKAFTSYKLYNGKKLLTETKDTKFETPVVKDTYNLKLVGYGKKLKSPARKQVFKVEESKLSNSEVVEAAIKWGEDIADDNSFHYGKKPWSVNIGCYFCGTNQPDDSKKAKAGGSFKQREKTWSCCTFVTACFVHGAKLKGIGCSKNFIGTGENKNGYLKSSKDWQNMGSLPYSSLKRGDVIMTKTHTVIYYGNGKCLESHGGDDGKPGSHSWNWSIGVHDYSNSRYHSRKPTVWRFVGNGASVTGLKVTEITKKAEENKHEDSK